MTLEIIGAGFPRTGTSSLKAALERLGIAPCGHMTTILHEPDRAAGWIDAWERTRRGEAVDWPEVVQGDRASVDAPACLFWRELAAAYPAARVVLGVRDAAAWYDSARETIFLSSGPGADPSRLAGAPPELVAGIAAITELNRITFWNGVMGERFLDRDHAIGVYEAHNAAVVAELPAERLLVFEAAEGWAPLCAFLGLPVPDEPFPRANDRETFRRRLADRPDPGRWLDRNPASRTD